MYSKVIDYYNWRFIVKCAGKLKKRLNTKYGKFSKFIYDHEKLNNFHGEKHRYIASNKKDYDDDDTYVFLRTPQDINKNEEQ